MSYKRYSLFGFEFLASEPNMKHTAYILSGTHEEFVEFVARHSRPRKDTGDVLEEAGFLHKVECIRVLDEDQIRGRKDLVVLVLPTWTQEFWVPGEARRMRELLQSSKWVRNWTVIYIKDPMDPVLVWPST